MPISRVYYYIGIFCDIWTFCSLNRRIVVKYAEKKPELDLHKCVCNFVCTGLEDHTNANIGANEHD